MKEHTYLIFAYEPIDKIRIPEIFDTKEEAVAFIEKVNRRRELHYFDVYLITGSNQLFSSHFDNGITQRELSSVFENFEGLEKEQEN